MSNGHVKKNGFLIKLEKDVEISENKQVFEIFLQNQVQKESESTLRRRGNRVIQIK